MFEELKKNMEPYMSLIYISHCGVLIRLKNNIKFMSKKNC